MREREDLTTTILALAGVDVFVKRREREREREVVESKKSGRRKITILHMIETTNDRG